MMGPPDNPVQALWMHRWLAAAPATILLLLVLGLVALPPVDIRTHSGFEMMRIAETLARNEGFAHPFEVADTGPTAVEPPLYPLFLAVCLKVFRNAELAKAAVILINAFAFGITVVLLRDLAGRLFGFGGIAAAALWIGSSIVWIYWDAGFTALVLVGFCFSTTGKIEPGRSAEACLLRGSLLGALFLLNPASLVIAFLWWGWHGLRRRGPARIFLLQSLGVCAVAAFIALPWVLRNYAVWGRLILRTNFGMTLYASNNPCAQPALDANRHNGCYELTHPNESLSEALLLQRVGEPAYDRMRTVDALQWIGANPRRFAALTAERALAFWFPLPSMVGFQAYVTWLVTLLFLPGLFWMWRKGESFAALSALIALLYPLVYYVVVADFRYRAPFGWTVILPAACLCDRMYRRAVAVYRAKIMARPSR